MGCVIGREASSGVINEEKSSRGGGNRKLDGAASGSRGEAVVEAQNGGKEEKGGGGGDGVQERQRGERRRSKGKANPRLSNPPRHLRGEQVAAGWPPWLTAVCGEALNGWIPRKADTFEKIDKVGLYHFPCKSFRFNLNWGEKCIFSLFVSVVKCSRINSG